MKNQAAVGTPNNGNRRRQSLSQADVRAIFSCINNNGHPPDGVDFRIIVIPKFGGNNGLKLSPPPYEYEDGVYVLLRLHVTIPSMVLDRLLLHRDLALVSERPWSLSGPQYSGESVDLQQRYCTPKGKEDKYCSSTKGSIWTMVDSNGKENFDCRVFHVYHSAKRAIHNNDGSPKKTVVSPKAKRRRLAVSKQPSPNVLMPENNTQESNTKVDVSFNERVGAEVASSPSNVGSACGDTNAGRDVLVAKLKRQRQKQSPSASKKSNTSTGKARQTTRSWSTAEDSELAKLVENEPDVARIAWNIFAHQMENRSGKQCRERYVNHLQPDRKKGKWTEVEDSHIIRLQATLGNQWSKIAAALPGRSDNDVKNRWHSRMRSQKRRQAKISSGRPSKGDDEESPDNATTKQVRKRSKSTSLMKGGPSRQGSAISSNADLATEETPKVGQRVQVKCDGDKMYEGTITKVSQQVNSTQIVRYKVMIHYDDGMSEENVFPDQDMHLVPMNNELTENEVMLCHELLNLHNVLKKPDEAGRKKNQVSEEESHDSSEHFPMDSREGSGSLQGSGSDSCKIDAEGSTADSDTKPPAKGSTVESETKPPAERLDDKDSLKPSLQATKAEVSKSDGLTALIASPPAMVAQMARAAVPHGCPPTGLNFQAPVFQHAPAPFFALPNQQQQQLLAAAQLLSSVNPGMAVAAIAQARQLHNIGVPHQGQAPGMFFPPRLQHNNGFPTNFTLPNFQPPLSVLSAPRREMNQNGELVAARLPAQPSPSSEAEHH